MRLFQGFSIRQKLLAIAMVTTLGGLLLACVLFIAFDVIMFRRAMVRDLETLAQIIIDNSSAAILFENQEDAEGVLNALQAKPYIVTALILATDRSIFAAYHRDKRTDGPAITVTDRLGHAFRDGHLELLAPIVLKGENLGTVYLKSDLQELTGRLKQYPGIVALVILLSSGVALLLSTKLQELISGPLLHLAHTSRSVSRERNYSVRATKQSDDELGELIDAFNQMLSQIQERDAALQQARDRLEQRVEERTKELQQEIAERKAAEEDLKTLATMLQRSNRELQNFAYVASHDLQEPLRKVQAFGDRLRLKCGSVLTEEGNDYLNRMQNAAKRMQNLITDLLAFSRISTQGNPFAPVPLDQILSDVLSDLEVRIQQTGAAIRVGDMPTIEADVGQMRQLFQNLISNALKFHKPDVTPVISIKSLLIPGSIEFEPAADVVEIVVEDNGIGFEEKYADRIFAMFQRLHGRDAYEGTGIGLAICRKIVERHHGKIGARSSPGNGAVFSVTLPVKQGKKVTE